MGFEIIRPLDECKEIKHSKQNESHMCETHTNTELEHLGDARKALNIFAPTRRRTTVLLLIVITLAVLPPLLRLVPLKASHASLPGPYVDRDKPAYEFRSQAYSDASELDYSVIWPGAPKIAPERAAESFRMRVEKEVTLIVTRGPTTANHTLPGCPYGEHVVEKIYAVLEGPAVVAPTEIAETSDGRSIVSLIAYDPGVYMLHVEAIFSCSNSNNNTIHRIRGSPFSVDVHGTASFPRKRCVDYRFTHGRWLECKQTPLLCARTGWVWVPGDCYSQVYSADEVINSERPTWVVFAGTSVERGSFFSLVDHLLGNRALNLTQSDFWKCWGWMDLKIGNFRASYLDLRPFIDLNITSKSPHSHIIEHDYIKHALHRMLEIGREGCRGPDLFHLEIESQYGRDVYPNEVDYIHVLRSFLGRAWRGKFVVTVGKMYSAFYARSRSPRTRFDMPGVYQALQRDHPDVLIEDETNMAAAMIDETIRVSKTENMGPGQWSFHYHRQCNVNGMHVCSPVCDAAVQQILNMAFNYGPVKQTKGMISHAAPIEFCLRCPSSLTPFTISPVAQAVCYDYVPREH